jgi:hypothetical protein
MATYYTNSSKSTYEEQSIDYDNGSHVSRFFAPRAGVAYEDHFYNAAGNRWWYTWYDSRGEGSTSGTVPTAHATYNDHGDGLFDYARAWSVSDEGADIDTWIDDFSEDWVDDGLYDGVEDGVESYFDDPV